MARGRYGNTSEKIDAMNVNNPEPDDEEQSKRFIGKAKALDAVNVEAFERAMKKVMPTDALSR